MDEELRSYPHDQSILKTSAISGGQFLPFECKKVAPRDLSRARLNPRADTIIISRMNTPDLVGECGYVEADYPNLFLPDRLWMTRNHAGSDVCVRWLNYLLSSKPYKNRIKGLATGTSGSMKNIAKDPLLAMPIPYPDSVEQRAIAGALSEVDALIGALAQLIAKKRGLKQATMQQLLTGQKRLPGFHGEWEVASFGSVFSKVNAKEHQVQTSEYQATGIFPIVDQGKEPVVGFSDRDDKRFQCPKDGVVIFGDHTCIVKFVDFDFVVGADGTQILAAKVGQCARFHAFQLQHRGIPTTGYNRHFKFLKERSFVSPPLREQTAIAEVLSDMDVELAALEQRRDKTRALKQGMMQELLTGRTRLPLDEGTPCVP
ncbi:MAG TPA: restriction endonuclease subunit S [Candidatus Binatia bacterium]|nr:restriction endonuclease subunit S [Candidatus Binatia bacterium]